MLFSTLIVSSTLFTFATARSCTGAGLPNGAEAGSEYEINQPSNGARNGTVTLSEGINGAVTVVDECSFSAEHIFSINLPNNTDPQVRWYGIPNGSELAIPIVDEILPANITDNGDGTFVANFPTNGTYALTRQGELIGGVSYQDFVTFNLFSDEYQWIIATANLPNGGGNTNGGGSNTDTKGKVNGAVELTAVTALALSFVGLLVL